MGWDIDRFPEGEVNLDLICCICTSILEDPVESPCRHVFCSQCIKTWLSNQKTCPHCRAPVHRKDLQGVVPLLKNIISKQRIYCDHREKGCEEIVALEMLQSHVAVCSYGMATCPNDGCELKVLRKDLRNHSEVCPKRTVLCDQGCEMLLTLGEKSSHNCIQSLQRHFEERTNDMLTRISKLEELVNVLVSKSAPAHSLTADSRQESTHASTSWPPASYTIPSPRQSQAPNYSVFRGSSSVNNEQDFIDSADSGDYERDEHRHLDERIHQRSRSPINPRERRNNQRRVREIDSERQSQRYSQTVENEQPLVLRIGVLSETVSESSPQSTSSESETD